jgi:hypothetical protein
MANPSNGAVLSAAGPRQSRSVTTKETGRTMSNGQLGMLRFALSGLAMLVLAGAVTAEEDNGPVLVDLFARTCAQRPTLPSEMERIASGLDFASEGGPISAEMETGPRIDILYSAKLMKRGEKVGLTAYFEGPIDGPTVICALTAVGVSAEALPGLIEKSLNAHDRSEKPPADDIRVRASWRAGTAGDGGTLEMSARRDSPRRASIQIVYRGRKR